MCDRTIYHSQLKLSIPDDVIVVVITPPLPRDGGTAQTLIQVHTVNLIEIRLGERWQPMNDW